MENKLGKLTVGQEVYVVQPDSRWTSGTKKYETIRKIGTKYAYIGDSDQSSFWKPFDKNTGVSIHDLDSNARANGYGFDVWLSEQAYEDHELARRRLKELNTRIVRCYGRLAELPCEIVEQFHQILDNSGWER